MQVFRRKNPLLSHTSRQPFRLKACVGVGLELELEPNSPCFYPYIQHIRLERLEDKLFSLRPESQSTSDAGGRMPERTEHLVTHFVKTDNSIDDSSEMSTHCGLLPWQCSECIEQVVRFLTTRVKGKGDTVPKAAQELDLQNVLVIGDFDLENACDFNPRLLMDTILENGMEVRSLLRPDTPSKIPEGSDYKTMKKYVSFAEADFVEKVDSRMSFKSVICFDHDEYELGFADKLLDLSENLEIFFVHTSIL